MVSSSQLLQESAWFFLGLDSESQRDLGECNPLVLLIKNTDASDDTFDTTAVLFRCRPNSTEENVWQIGMALRKGPVFLAAQREGNRAQISRENFLTPLSTHVFEITMWYV